MPNLIIYAPLYKDQSGEIKQAYLRINAANCLGYYIHYPYLSAELSLKKQAGLTEFSERTCNELLARARRVINFSDESKLRPVKYCKKKFGSLASRVYSAGSCDHISYWESYWGTKFVLNEPYRVNPNYIMKLEALGLVASELSLNISPYCGRWDPNPGAKPWIRSFLICDANDINELEGLFGQYYKHIQISSMDDELIETIELIPAWNNLEGIKHA